MLKPLTNCNYCDPGCSIGPLPLIFECDQKDNFSFQTGDVTDVCHEITAVAFNPDLLDPHFRPPVPYKFKMDFIADITVLSIDPSSCVLTLTFNLIKRNKIGIETTLKTWTKCIDAGAAGYPPVQDSYAFPYCKCLNCDIDCTEYVLQVCIAGGSPAAIVILDNCCMTTFAQGKCEPRRFPEPPRPEPPRPEPRP